MLFKTLCLKSDNTQFVRVIFESAIIDDSVSHNPTDVNYAIAYISELPELYPNTFTMDAYLEYLMKHVQNFDDISLYLTNDIQELTVSLTPVNLNVKPNIDLQKITNWFESEEGQKSLDEFANELKKEQEIEFKQLERFKELGNFEQFTDKVIEKYNSDKYQDRWYNRGIEPPEDLFWFLFNYAEKYGRECTTNEWEQYGNDFTSALFFCNGYYFNRMEGQGTKFIVTKLNQSNK